MARFQNRVSAGRELLQKLLEYKDDAESVVVGLPRGGMVTAFEIAKGLNLPLGYLIVKKIGVPGNAELAIGAVTNSGTRYIETEVVSTMNILKTYIDDEIEKKKREAEARSVKYAKNYKNPDLLGKTVLLIDDGVATGSTVIAAIKSLKLSGAKKIIVSIPAGPLNNFEKIKQKADRVIYVDEDTNLFSVGEYYEEFPEVTDEEVVKILENAKNIPTK